MANRKNSAVLVWSAIVISALAISFLGNYAFDDQRLFSGTSKTDMLDKDISVELEKKEINGDEENGAKNKNTEDILEEEPMPTSKTITDVPFVAQAPFGDWKDPLEQHGCEEICLIMARHWITAKELTPQMALDEIRAISKYEKDNYGGPYDLSAADTLKLWREYYGYKKSSVKYDIAADDIKKEIAKGNLVIAPIDGLKLKNLHYTPPGPAYHQILIIGYDDTKNEFITNDAGTKFGKSYRYSYDEFVGAIRDYKTGFDEPLSEIVKAMIVIEKE